MLQLNVKQNHFKELSTSNTSLLRWSRCTIKLLFLKRQKLIYLKLLFSFRICDRYVVGGIYAKLKNHISDSLKQAPERRYEVLN